MSSEGQRQLQYVLEQSPLQAGVFMVPIMVAAALGGPVAGYLSAKFGLRLVAILSMALASAALALFAVSNLHNPGLSIPVLLATLGLSLSIGLTASSIAIMGSVEASKGGAAGSLEATGYELGTGLGITFFGVFMSAVYARSFQAPAQLTEDLALEAARSIGDSYLVSAQLAADQGASVIAAGKAAFSTTHSVLLLTAATLIGTLGVVVYFLLAKVPKGAAGHG